MVIRPCAGRSAKRTLNVINYEQNATSLCRLHVATQAREPASLLRFTVVRVGVAYGVAAWVILQVADLVLDDNVSLCEALSVQ